jgi:hypothetical protein
LNRLIWWSGSILRLRFGRGVVQRLGWIVEPGDAVIKLLILLGSSRTKLRRR